MSLHRRPTSVVRHDRHSSQHTLVWIRSVTTQNRGPARRHTAQAPAKSVDGGVCRGRTALCRQATSDGLTGSSSSSNVGECLARDIIGIASAVDDFESPTRRRRGGQWQWFWSREGVDTAEEVEGFSKAAIGISCTFFMSFVFGFFVVRAAFVIVLAIYCAVLSKE